MAHPRTVATRDPMAHSPIEHYPALAQVKPSLAQAGLEAAVMTIPAGVMLFDEASACQGFPLVLDGEVKVSRHSGDGRMLELYRISPGEICLVSCASLFQGQALTARAVTTRASQILLIPPPIFQLWLDEPHFRQEVLGLFAQRMVDLTALVDAVAFRRLDQRLAATLLGHGQTLTLTHQALADELGTVREMVTRLLHRFERENWIALGREHIRILDSAALRHQASADRP